MGMRAGGLGIGGLLIMLVLSWATGVDFLSLLGGGGGGAPVESVGTSGASGTVASTPEEEKLVDFVDAVMEDTQQTWGELLGNRYQPTKARLFRDGVESGCGFAQSASGPFYCPADHFVYLDVGFFNDLRRKFGASGDFAEAYVLAHEVGHHVQSLLGLDGQIRQQQASDPRSRNDLSVRLELQADCFAGVWAHATNKSGRAGQGRVELEGGDLEEGLRAAAAIGDDRIQRMSTGHVFPEKFTHGSSEQRVTWLRRGFESGNPDACNTFQ
uniref:Putative neutral zinc metallopeptidase n=1 Tax=uncultured bacterium 66 TaxID=698391 RepID=E3T664_9BACT|nr:putative neutral zinc metallopeptidase [uncultured bacterium 66]